MNKQELITVLMEVQNAEHQVGWAMDAATAAIGRIQAAQGELRAATDRLMDQQAKLKAAIESMEAEEDASSEAP